MRFQVHVGTEFPCFAGEDHSPSFVVNVNQQIANSAPPREVASSAKRVVSGKTVALVVIGVVTLVGAIAYGFFTGDFSLLKSILEGGRSLLELGTNSAKSS